MRISLSKQDIFNELKAFVAAIGVWTLTSLVLMLITSFIFGVTPNKIGILATIIGLAAGIFVAYTINDRKIPKLTLGMMIIVGAIFYILTSFIGRSMVFGPGMEPSYKDREGIWVDRFTVEFNKPKRGDVVLVQNSSGGDSIKRVIGLPGEEIKLVGSMVVINGDSVLVEPYVKTTERCAMGVSFINPYVSTYKLDSYEYLVLSDNNRLELQPPTVVSQTNIIGRVLGQKGQPTITKLSPTGLKEYNNPELKISFQYSSGCLVESKEKNKITVKESQSGSALLDITLFAQNPKRLTTEEWINDNYKVVESIYCKQNENCRVRPGDKIFQITERFTIDDLQYVAGSYKDSKYLGKDLTTGYGLFVAAGDNVYLISSGTDKKLLETINFLQQ